ncbi:transmembrane amino acid transporter protein [Oesophagostomum dentatum]|uniref:Transmembrane amino acid transporter protein n=1 Tax=Oesophagostomum dentatum TaxID=61180 RepID=A0A0B1TSR5_OESDE|nr:transmembrane amino acid transporter protein [Oesophagostomum dentatum]
MAGTVDASTSYSPLMGLLYIFNLIVGTGALALPKAFQHAGYILSLVILAVSAIVSYISATFVLEALAIGNAAQKRKQVATIESKTDDESKDFEIKEKIEVSQMANMFLTKAGVIVCYVAMDVYLFGDLAIYSTTVPKSLMNIICASASNPSSIPNDHICREGAPEFFTRFTVYRLCIVLFIMVTLPMIIVGVTKTKYLQLATTISRWLAFILMIILAIVQVSKDGPAKIPPAVDMHGFGSLFGVTVYAFMCHHSIPSLVTPMSSKSRVFIKIFLVYVMVFSFYVLLSMTGSFAFDDLMDVYTLNFLKEDFTNAFQIIVNYFLALFPVFVITTNYPIIGCTLINNVRVLRDMIFASNAKVYTEEQTEADKKKSKSFLLLSDIIIYVTMIGLPTVISILTDDMLLLATITGSYPGVGVQFLVPCLLIIYSRRYAERELKTTVPYRYSSPFASKYWILAIFVWAVFSIVMVTLNLVGVKF